MSKTNEELIREVYYDPLTGFSGVNKTFLTLKKQGHKISRKEIQQFIKKQERKTLENPEVSFHLIHYMNFKLI